MRTGCVYFMNAEKSPGKFVEPLKDIFSKRDDKTVSKKTMSQSCIMKSFYPSEKGGKR